MPNVTIPDLNDGGAATSIDEFEISRSAVSFRVSLSDIATYTNGLLTAGAPTGFDTFAEVAASLALKQPLDATLTAFAGVTFAADKGLYSTGADAFTTYDLTAAGRALGGVAGTSGTFPYFSASNVVTLGTITAAGLALLDDANAAAQLATLGAAPLASPTFTGTPAGPTASPGTNTTQLATTAFVTAAVGGGGGGGTVTSVSGTGTVSGLTLTGTVTTSGSLTLGGTLSVAVANLPVLEGLGRIQVTGSGAAPNSGSGVEIVGGASGVIQAGTRTAGVLAYTTLSLDAVSVALRPSGVANLVSSAGQIDITAAAINEGAEVSLSSAGTTNIASAVANSIQITGTTTITAFGTAASGAIRRVRFAAALTLTHNATSLILPTGANITTAANDTAEFMSLGSGNWFCTRYNRASGAALASTSGVQNNFAATAAPTATDDSSAGYAAGSTWMWVAKGRVWRLRDATASAAKWWEMGAADQPGYIAGNWYNPFEIGAVAAGSAPASGSVRCTPFMLKSRVTMSDLGVRVTTLSAGGNVQLAIYANDPATMRPTGTVLANTGAISTAATGIFSAAIAGGNVTLEPGMYWACINSDNSTAVFQYSGTAAQLMVSLVGSTTLAVLSNTATLNLQGIAVTMAYGTWSTMTGASFLESSNTSFAIVYFKAA